MQWFRISIKENLLEKWKSTLKNCFRSFVCPHYLCQTPFFWWRAPLFLEKLARPLLNIATCFFEICHGEISLSFDLVEQICPGGSSGSLVFCNHPVGSRICTGTQGGGKTCNLWKKEENTCTSYWLWLGSCWKSQWGFLQFKPLRHGFRGISFLKSPKWKLKARGNRMRMNDHSSSWNLICWKWRVTYFIAN